jgi:hypothetical protein
MGEAGHRCHTATNVLEQGRLLRSIHKGGRIGEGLSDWTI